MVVLAGSLLLGMALLSLPVAFAMPADEGSTVVHEVAGSGGTATSEQSQTEQSGAAAETATDAGQGGGGDEPEAPVRLPSAAGPKPSAVATAESFLDETESDQGSAGQPPAAPATPPDGSQPEQQSTTVPPLGQAWRGPEQEGAQAPQAQSGDDGPPERQPSPWTTDTPLGTAEADADQADGASPADAEPGAGWPGTTATLLGRTVDPVRAGNEAGLTLASEDGAVVVVGFPGAANEDEVEALGAFLSAAQSTSEVTPTVALNLYDLPGDEKHPGAVEDFNAGSWTTKDALDDAVDSLWREYTDTFEPWSGGDDFKAKASLAYRLGMPIRLIDEFGAQDEQAVMAQNLMDMDEPVVFIGSPRDVGYPVETGAWSVNTFLSWDQSPGSIPEYSDVGPDAPAPFEVDLGARSSEFMPFMFGTYGTDSSVIRVGPAPTPVAEPTEAPTPTDEPSLFNWSFEF